MESGSKSGIVKKCLMQNFLGAPVYIIPCSNEYKIQSPKLYIQFLITKNLSMITLILLPVYLLNLSTDLRQMCTAEKDTHYFQAYKNWRC